MEQAANNPVVIVDYNPLGPKQFETLRGRLANVLGGLALTVEHVGSAAVPGLAAKPIIDSNAKREFVEAIVRKSASDKAVSKLAVSSPNAGA